MADKKLNTGLSAEEVRRAFSRALNDMTDAQIRAEMTKLLGAEKQERLQHEDTLSGMISAFVADVSVNYVKLTAFDALTLRVDALEERLAALEKGGTGDA